MKIAKVVVLVTCFSFFACGPLITDQQQEQLNELTKKVDSLHEAISKVDSMKIIAITKGFSERRKTILSGLEDTLSPETLFFLDTFLIMKKPMQFFEAHYFPILNESRIAKKQLIDLNTDIANRLIDKDRFQSYYELEQDNFVKLMNVSIEIVEKYNRITDQYERMLPKVDSIINASRKKPNV